MIKRDIRIKLLETLDKYGPMEYTELCNRAGIPETQREGHLWFLRTRGLVKWTTPAWQQLDFRIEITPKGKDYLLKAPRPTTP